ncbi:MAG: glutamate-1-semialdehyde 2,1-aminomutase [Geobacteraceae bacterium]|nr:glutamate-1-semialdehyde 2,1-aminomutase [Geobacteraceae bacterium]
MPGPIVKFDRCHEIQRKLHQLVPAGSHTYSKGEDQFPYLSPQIMSHADGAYCWDIDGNKFIDWAMGNRVIILGHNYPAVNEAVIRQMAKGLNFTRPGILEYELAEYLVDLFPAAEMVKFGKNGSDVTTAAVKLARAYTGRNIIAYCKDHPFFSIHDWFISKTPCNSGIVPGTEQSTLSFTYNDIESVKQLFAENPNKIAGLILEPVKNEEPRDNFLAELKAICEKEGAVLIFDEMIAGMRFDIRGAHHLWKVYPHLTTYGKCISNGFSFSALAGKREIMELGGIQHDKRRAFLLSQTHGSETVGLAAAFATIQECQRVKISEHTWGIGKKLVDGVRALAKEEKVDDLVRIIGFDCNPQILCTHEDGRYWPELHTSFHEEVISHGVLIPWISITYAHGQQELDLTFSALREGMRKVRRVVDAEKVNESFVGEAVKPVFRAFNKCRQNPCGMLDPQIPPLDCCLQK